MITSVPRRIVAVAGAAVVVVIALWYFAVWSPQAKNLKAARAAHTAAEAKITHLQSQMVELRALVREIPVDEANLAALDQNIPDRPQFDSILLQVHQAGNSSGAQVTTVTPSGVAGASGGTTGGGGAGSAVKGGVPSIALSISATGTPGQVSNFLVQLDQMQRTLVIDHISLSSGTTLVSTNIAARVFYAGQPTP